MQLNIRIGTLAGQSVDLGTSFACYQLGVGPEQKRLLFWASLSLK